MNNASGETSPSSSSVLFKNQSTELLSPAAGPDTSSKALDQHYSKPVETWYTASSFKHRAFRPNSVATSGDMSVHSIDSDWSESANNQDPDDLRRGSHHDQLAMQWEQDPFDTDPRLTKHLLELYFLHAGRATYGMFPRRPFLTWVETNREKDQDHLMLIYSVLALGSVFSTDAEHRGAGKWYASVAAYAMEKRFGRFTLQLCQSRLMLGLYHFARGKSQEAWDYCGAGLRALSALKLNSESGIQDLPETVADMPYGFDRSTLEECCRRTFWSGFLMDVSSTAFTASTTPNLIHQQRYNGFCGGTLCVINIEDTFLRLPCLESTFEEAAPCHSPMFNFEILNRQAYSGPPLGHMAYLILISTIWGDVVTFTSRAVHRSDASYEQVYETFYAKTHERLEAWLAMLPANLRVSSRLGSIVSRHTLTVSCLPVHSPESRQQHRRWLCWIVHLPPCSILHHFDPSQSPHSFVCDVSCQGRSQPRAGLLSCDQFRAYDAFLGAGESTPTPAVDRCCGISLLYTLPGLRPHAFDRRRYRRRHGRRPSGPYRDCWHGKLMSRRACNLLGISSYTTKGRDESSEAAHDNRYAGRAGCPERYAWTVLETVRKPRGCIRERRCCVQSGAAASV